MADHSPEAVRLSRTRAQYEQDELAEAYAHLYRDVLPVSRFFQSRLFVVMDALRACSGGALLDVGCGPGMFIRRLVEERPGDFRVHGVDASPAMVRTARTTLGEDEAELVVSRAESLPFDEDEFDVVIAMGVLEYVDIQRAIEEIGRVVRPGGTVVATMLNPLSPYRAFEWGLYWPLLRVLGEVEAWSGRPADRRHGAARTGIRALPSRRLCRLMRTHGLVPVDVVGYDVNLLLPPVDKIVRRRRQGWRERPWTTVSRGPRRVLGTAYLVTARRV